MLSKKSILGSFIAMAMLAGCSSTPAASTGTSDASGSDFDSSNDITVISRESGSGTRGAFIELTGVEEKQGDQKVDMTTDDAQVVNSTSVVLTTVETDPYAIGYVSLGTLNDKVKAIKVTVLKQQRMQSRLDSTSYPVHSTLQQKVNHPTKL